MAQQPACRENFCCTQAILASDEQPGYVQNGVISNQGIIINVTFERQKTRHGHGFQMVVSALPHHLNLHASRYTDNLTLLLRLYLYKGYHRNDGHHDSTHESRY